MPTRCEHEIVITTIDSFLSRQEDGTLQRSYYMRGICRCPDAPHAPRVVHVGAMHDYGIRTEEGGCCDLRCKYFKAASVPNRLP